MLITHVEPLGPFLRFYGQQRRDIMNLIRAKIDIAIRISMTRPPPRLVDLHIGTICLARLNGQHFCRAKVVTFQGTEDIVLIYLDYGCEYKVRINEIRLLVNGEDTILTDTEYQATPFILTGIFANWKADLLRVIFDEINNHLVSIEIITEVYEFKFATILWKGVNFGEYLISKNIGAPITLQNQLETFMRILNKSNETMKSANAVNNNSIKAGRGLVPTRQLHYNAAYTTRQPMIRTTNSGYVAGEMGVLPPPPRRANNNPKGRNENKDNQNYQVVEGPPAFKSNTLMVGRYYDVFGSFVENGPFLFSIQLKSTKDTLDKMMAELETIPLKNLAIPVGGLSLGLACIARFSEDSHLYRAVIMSTKQTACQVVYIDYGNTELVAFHDLYEIPPMFLETKAFAIRFSLSGYKDIDPVDESLKATFKDLVLQKQLKLKVMPLEGPALVQYCELYDGDVNVLDFLKSYMNKKLGYGIGQQLYTNEIVVISYVETPKKFFVQKVMNMPTYEKMMDDLFLFCQKSRSSLKHFTKGAACAVKYENAWYRAEIIGKKGTRVSIKHVDFGNERCIDPNQLCAITEQLVKFPPQAIECCLKGFEEAETLSDSASVQLEMLAENNDGERRHFKCQTFGTIQNGVLVNLIDDKMRPELNLMKKLYKLSMPFNKYLGLEKESSATIPTTSNMPSDSTRQYLQPSPPPSSVLLNSTIMNVNEGNFNQGAVLSSQDWEAGSSESKDTPTSPTDQFRRKPGNQSRPYRERENNNNKRDSFPSYKAKTNLPPRFQRQAAEGRGKPRDNRFNNSYDRQKDSSSDSSGKFSQSTRTSRRNESGYHESSPSYETIDVETYVPYDIEFSKLPINTPGREEAIICWWMSPHQFFIHQKSRILEFESMMRHMQVFYKDKPTITISPTVGSSVIVRYREDNILYRAKIIACNPSLKKYKVLFVDFGNQSTTDESNIWSVEKRFSELPVMANLCSFDKVVSNYDHKYITQEVEKLLKPGSTLHCEYLRKENDLYYVDIFINDRSLRESLIQTGVISLLEPNITLEMLTGQQVKMHIVSVKDLLNFQITIEGCDLKLLGSYNDIKFIRSNSYLSVEFKRDYEGKDCVADVIDVSKEKILMLQPIIPLFTHDVPKRICDYPILCRAFDVKIIYVHNENILYAHPVAVESDISQLLDDMFNYYDVDDEIFDDIKIGSFCAVNSVDGNWYRGKIINITENESIEIYYIDYGSTEIINETNKIKRLNDEFCKSSAFAIGIYLPVKSINDENEAVINEIRTLTSGYELTLQLTERYKNKWIADVSSNGYSIMDVLKDKLLIQGTDIEYVKNLIDNEKVIEIVSYPTDAVKVNKPAVIIPKIVPTPKFNIPEPAVDPVKDNSFTIANNYEDDAIIPYDEIQEEEEEQQQQQQHPIEGMTAAYLSHCDNPGRFFLQLESTYSELEKLQDNLQIVAGSLPPLMSFIDGAMCIALYSVDETWYRARIIDSEINVIQFIDYGNTDVITDNSYIKEMNEAFENIQPFAIPCALPIAPKTTVDWIDDANIIFNNSYEKTIYFDYVAKGPTKNYVNVNIDDQDVSEKLIADDMARRLEVFKSGENCFISHINDLSDFYIQMEQDANGLELIAGHLTDFENFPLLSNCIPGTVCAALFPDDLQWYRAKILTHSDSGTEVLFIDYGNTAMTTELRKISTEIANLPFLSKKCTLRMPDYILGWSELAETKFTEISGLGETVCRVELKEPGDHAIVDLFIGDTNILEQLEPLCDKRPKISLELNSSREMDRISPIGKVETAYSNVVISHVNGPNDFYVQLKTDTASLNQITESLNANDIVLEKLSTFEIDTICVAVFPDDGAFYRAKILSSNDDGCEVIFIDFGNKSFSQDLRIIPANLKVIDCLAKHCSLENKTNIDFWSLTATEHFCSSINSHFGEIFQIDILEKNVDPWIVKLFYNETDMCTELINAISDSNQLPEKAAENDDANEKVNEKITQVNETIVSDNQPKISLELTSSTEMDRISPIGKDDTENQYSNAVISHINGPSDFYVQLKSDTAALEKITDSLNASDLVLEKLTIYEIDTICVAVFPDDGAFYRAKILSSNDDGCAVLFIDFGNRSFTKDLRILPTNFKAVDCLAKHCSLENKTNIDLWSDTVIQHFSSVINSHFGEIFHVDILEKDVDPWIVKLFYKETDICADLINAISDSDQLTEAAEICISTEASTSTAVKDDANEKVNETLNLTISTEFESAVISHSNSPNDFYIQLDKYADKLKEITEALLDAKNFEHFTNPKPNDICIAHFTDDGAYYRSKVLWSYPNTTEVLFLDYGITTFTTDLRQITDNLKDIEYLAKRCAIQSKNEIDFCSVNAIKIFNELISSHLCDTFQVKIIEKSSDPWIIELHLNEKNISSELDNMIEMSKADQTSVWDTIKETSGSIVSNEIIENIIENVNLRNDVSSFILEKIDDYTEKKDLTNDITSTILEKVDEYTEKKVLTNDITSTILEKVDECTEKNVLTNDITSHILNKIDDYTEKEDLANDITSQIFEKLDDHNMKKDVQREAEDAAAEIINECLKNNYSDEISIVLDSADGSKCSSSSVQNINEKTFSTEELGSQLWKSLHNLGMSNKNISVCSSTSNISEPISAAAAIRGRALLSVDNASRSKSVGCLKDRK